MSTDLAVINTQLVALSPDELVPAQAQLIGWCRAKIVALSLELKEQRENLRQCKAMLWRSAGWNTAITRTKKRMIYYAKIKTAVQCGYLVVPNFDVDVVAVRVKRSTPNAKTDEKIAIPELLPPGVGRYVGPRHSGYDSERQYKDYEGKLKTTTDFHPTGYDDEYDFPVAMVKPIILDATDRAMAHRIFDRVGVVRGKQKSDPIVVGQIIDPSNSKWARGINPKCVSFFVAWWLDTKDL